MVSRFVSAGEFLEGVFLSSISFFQITSFFLFFFKFVWMQCTKCQECRKTYYCVVVQGMKWCFCFVSCHKWSVLDVQFRVKMIESCSSRASTSGVDIFWGWGWGWWGILYLFCNLFHRICVGANASASELRTVFWHEFCLCMLGSLSH